MSFIQVPLRKDISGMIEDHLKASINKSTSVSSCRVTLAAFLYKWLQEMFIKGIALFLFPPVSYKKLLGFTFKATWPIAPWPPGVMKPDEKQAGLQESKVVKWAEEWEKKISRTCSS